MPNDTCDPKREIETPAVPVVLRVHRRGGEVFALFPTLPSDVAGSHCTAYAHVGQHSSADYDHCIQVSRPATLQEGAPLVRELERIGYYLQIVPRATLAMHQTRLDISEVGVHYKRAGDMVSGESLHAIMVDTNREYFDRYGEDPEGINSGLCEDYAHRVVQRLGRGKAIWNDEADDPQVGEGEGGAHCFISVDGLYYDAECLEGVGDWRELPFFQRARKRTVDAGSNKSP